MQLSPRCAGSDDRLHQGSVEPRVGPALLVLALISACKNSTNRAVTAEMQIGFSLRVDCWLGRLSHRFPHKVVSEVDEMCLFHQLGYGSRKRGWRQSTIALLSGLQEIRLRRRLALPMQSISLGGRQPCQPLSC